MKVTYKGENLIESIGGLSENALKVLNTLHFEGGMTLSKVIWTTNIRKEAVKSAVKELVEKELIVIGDEQF